MCACESTGSLDKSDTKSAPGRSLGSAFGRDSLSGSAATALSAGSVAHSPKKCSPRLTGAASRHQHLAYQSRIASLVKAAQQVLSARTWTLYAYSLMVDELCVYSSNDWSWYVRLSLSCVKEIRLYKSTSMLQSCCIKGSFL